jgi:hypothetical protein
MSVTAIGTVSGAFAHVISTLISASFLHFWPVQLAQELGKKSVISFAALQYDYISALPLHKRCNSAQAKSISSASSDAGI